VSPIVYQGNSVAHVEASTHNRGATQHRVGRGRVRVGGGVEIGRGLTGAEEITCARR